MALGALGALAWRRLDQARVEAAIGAHADAIYRSPQSFVAGNAKGEVSVVAFFDHNCPDCRADVPALEKLIAQDGGVRLVLKELPVLGPDSEAVARIALAAKAQGKYFELYRALFAARGRITKDRALQIAGELGLDTARLEEDARNASVTEALADTKTLARALEARGVPFYLVGDEVMTPDPARFYTRLTQAVDAVRRNGCRSTSAC
jgi:protein-disulfide isomerase